MGGGKENVVDVFMDYNNKESFLCLTIAHGFRYPAKTTIVREPMVIRAPVRLCRQMLQVEIPCEDGTGHMKFEYEATNHAAVAALAIGYSAFGSYGPEEILVVALTKEATGKHIMDWYFDPNNEICRPSMMRMMEGAIQTLLARSMSEKKVVHQGHI